MTWSQIVTATLPDSSTAPGTPGLVGMAMCLNGKTGNVILHGGQGPTGPSNSTWEFDGIDWTNVTSTSTVARHNTDLEYLESTGQIYMPCGYQTNETNDIWTRGQKTWGSFTVKGTDCPSSIGQTPLRLQRPGLQHALRRAPDRRVVG